MSTPTVRRDRKFWVSLALHKAVQEHLNEDPDRVIDLGIIGVKRTLPHTRGSATTLALRWLDLLETRDIRAINEVLVGTDEVSVEMRNLAIFLGVLTQSERREVLDDVYARLEQTG